MNMVRYATVLFTAVPFKDKHFHSQVFTSIQNVTELNNKMPVAAILNMFMQLVYVLICAGNEEL